MLSLNSMKIICLLLFVIGFSQARATHVFCQSNSKDVSVELNWLSDEISIQVISPMGYAQLPMIEGPLRPGLLEWNRYQFQQLEPLGSRFEVRFAKKLCNWTVSENKKDTKLECNGSSTLAPKELLFTSFTLTRVTESTLKDQYFTRRFRMTVVRSGEFGADTFFVTIPVAESGCLDYE